MSGNLFCEVIDRAWEGGLFKYRIFEITEAEIRLVANPFHPESVGSRTIQRLRESCHLSTGETSKGWHREVTILYAGY